MKFNLSAIILSLLTMFGENISVNIGSGFIEGPFRVSGIFYGLLSSTIGAIILSFIPWWGKSGAWIGYFIANSIIIYFKYKKHVNVTI